MKSVTAALFLNFDARRGSDKYQVPVALLREKEPSV
jgi:hypothetical protein